MGRSGGPPLKSTQIVPYDPVCRPQFPRVRVIVGYPRLHLTWMAHDQEEHPKASRAKRGKSEQVRCAGGVIPPPGPRSRPGRPAGCCRRLPGMRTGAQSARTASPESPRTRSGRGHGTVLPRATTKKPARRPPGAVRAPRDPAAGVTGCRPGPGPQPGRRPARCRRGPAGRGSPGRRRGPAASQRKRRSAPPSARPPTRVMNC